MFEVFDEGSAGLVDDFAGVGQGALDVAVVVPHLVAVEDLDEPDSAFDESAGEEAAFSVGVGFFLSDAVHFLGGFGFLGEVECFAGGGLHACGEFVAGDAGFEVEFSGAFFEVSFVEVFEVVEIVGLCVAFEVMGDIEVQDAGFFRAYDGSLIDGGEPAVGPEIDSGDGEAGGVGEGDVGGEVLRFCSEAIGEPASERGASFEDAS